MPKRSEYQPLTQPVDGDLEEEDVGLHHSQPIPSSPAVTSRRGKKPQIDLRTIDSAFKKWTENIAQKVKRKKHKTTTIERQEIMHSVFGPEVSVPRNYSRTVKTLDHAPPMTHEEYVAMTETIRAAITDGVHPKMISKGSSGSYFARAKVGRRLQIVGVFKPKDEEPYGRLNPKTTKWLHHDVLIRVINDSYISEAAASLLDERLQLYIVPRTELVTFSSPAFFYDWLDRSAAKKGKPLPGKIGSMQCFLPGFQDASEFLRAHPFPGRSISDTFDDSTHRTGGATKRFLSAIQVLCGRTGDEDLFDDDDDEERIYGNHGSGDGVVEGSPFYWSGMLQQNFREELEKLVILDFLMRNTDRGADNYMLKYCEGSHERSLIDIAPTRSTTSQMPIMRERMTVEPRIATLTPSVPYSSALGSSSTSLDSGVPRYTKAPHLHLAAIDNSLAWPHEHPKGWRSFTYGWLYLPVSVIGRPFSEKTRNHFLPLLSSKAWWEETTYQLHKLFAVDPDFHPKMFRRQLAVMKGQAWNIVQCLKHSDEGPLELTRRQKVLVWDDEVEISEEDDPSDAVGSARSVDTEHMPQNSRGDFPVPIQFERRVRSRSIGSFPFPPPMRRSTTDGATGTRPVPFAGKFQKINPGASGVTVLEHMERLDEVERGLKKLGMEEAVVVEEEEEEGDLGVITDKARDVSAGFDLLDQDIGEGNPEQPEPSTSTPMSAPVLPDYQSDEEADRRMSQSDVLNGTRGRGDPNHFRTASERDSRRSADWVRSGEGPQGPQNSRKRIVIVERLETVGTKPFFSCW